MNPQQWADRKCALCEHFSTSAKTDKPGDIENAFNCAFTWCDMRKQGVV